MTIPLLHHRCRRSNRRRSYLSGGRQGCSLRGRIALLLAAIVAAAVLAGCSSVRNDLGTVDSDCYIALPAAFGAVGHHGTLLGVRLETVASLRHHATNLYEAAASAPEPKPSQVCLVAFHGHFAASNVSHALGRATGRLAVVELAYPGNHVLATLLVTRAPFGFGHPHL